MTVGQRILKKRKELGLSQEALGQELGVSRQAIYKWEQDAALPEVEKLIALSKLFSVTVGWLLGVEEELETPSGELSDTQLGMVREIVDGYLEARPAPQPRKWPRVLTTLAIIALTITIISLFYRLENIRDQYNILQNSISSVSSSMNHQMGLVTQRVEDILQSQNDLVADWETGIESMNYGENTVTIKASVVPKVYSEGMTAKLVAQWEGGSSESALTGDLNAPYPFTGTVTCPLIDEKVRVSVVFNIGDGRYETQYLQEYGHLYSESMPSGYMHAETWMNERQGTLPRNTWVDVEMPYYDSQWAEEVKEVRVGLFKDRELVIWYEPSVREVINGSTGKPFDQEGYSLPEMVVLEPGSVYCTVVIFETISGRLGYFADTPIQCSEKGDWSFANNYAMPDSVEGWKY